MKKKVFCEKCKDDVFYKVFEVNLSDKFKGKMYDYLGQRAVCNKCGSEVDVPEVRDFNLKAIYDAYRIKNDIISLEKILEIPKKYNIGKRQLSVLLGWTELSFTRYCEGYLPEKQYSDILKQVYDSPAFYLNLIESNRGILVSLSAYQKSKRAAEALLHDKR